MYIGLVLAAYLYGRYQQYKSDQKKVQGNLKNLL